MRGTNKAEVRKIEDRLKSLGEDVMKKVMLRKWQRRVNGWGEGERESVCKLVHVYIINFYILCSHTFRKIKPAVC